VAPANLALQRLVGFDPLLEENSYDVKIDVSWKRGTPPLEVVELFSLAADGDGCITRNDYCEDGNLAIHVRDYIPSAQLKTGRLRDPSRPRCSTPAAAISALRSTTRR
jgi:hypothetical protein